MLTRTVHTLRKRTEIVDSFNLTPSRAIEVRRLAHRRSVPHFIVVYKQDTCASGNDWDVVVVITEVSCINSIINFDVKPSKQYPELVALEDGLKDKIRDIVANSLCA